MIRFLSVFFVDNHDRPVPSINLAVEQLDLSSFTSTEGDVVYVHWHACGEFPAGWYRAVLVHN